MPPSELIVNVPPCIWSGLSLPSRASLASSPISLAISGTVFLSTSRITGTIRPLRRVGGEADVPVVLQHQRVAVEAGVELGELLQRRHRRLHHERQHADLDARLLQLLVHLHAELLEVGDVGLVVGRHVRDHDPVAVQVGGRDLLDARQLLALDRAELGEVDLRPGQQVEAGATAGGRRGCAFGAGAAARTALREGLDVVAHDAAVRRRCP